MSEEREAGRRLSLEECAGILRSAGYDVQVADVLVGRRDRGEYVREIVVDAAGRVRLTESILTAPARGTRVWRGPWEFHLVRESFDVSTLLWEVGSPAGLQNSLKLVESLLGAAGEDE